MHGVGITNREVIAGFRNLVADKAQISDDSGWSQRFIYYHLLRYRARLIREKVRRDMPISHWNYQTIDCIPLEKTDLSECPCVPADGCVFMRTKLRIPKPLDRLKSVTSTDGQITYTYVEWERLKHKLTSRFEGERSSAYYTLKTRQDGTHLYLYNDTHKKYITVTGVFENPLEVQFFTDCEGNVPQCRNPLDQEFILDPDITTIMYDLAIRQLTIKQPYSDLDSDDTDNLEPVTPRREQSKKSE